MIISIFFSIIIEMYYNEGSHNRRHFHISYKNLECSFDFDTREIIVGDNMPRKVLKLVNSWVDDNFVKIEENWNNSKSGKKMFKIEGKK